MNKLLMTLLKPIDLAAEALVRLFVRGFEVGSYRPSAPAASDSRDDRSGLGAEMVDLGSGYRSKPAYLFHRDPVFGDASRF